jgi:PAS domain S-box-containing protein
MSRLKLMKQKNEQQKTQNTGQIKRKVSSPLGSELAQYWLDALIESADDAIVSKTLDSAITSWNKGAERIFGYTADEVIGKSIVILIPPDRHNEEPLILERIKAGERVEHFETVRLTKDGRLIDVSLTISPIRGPSGEIVGVSKIARDITDLKKAHRLVEASEERYRMLFDSIDEGFCVIRMIFDERGKPADYIFLELNPIFIEQTGLTQAAPGKTMRELIPNHDESWFEIYGRVSRTGEPIRFENYAEVLDRWFDLYAFRIGEPEDHKVAVMFKNITDRKKAEAERERLLKQLENERAKLNYLFTNAPAFVATLRGPEHIFELANPAYRQLIGHREVIGKAVREALPEVDGQGFIELLDTVFQTGEPFVGKEISVWLQRENGGLLENRFVDFVYQPIFADNKAVSGIFVHGIDITEQVRSRKEAEDANRAKDEFLATLSHELRTPINAILGWSKMMTDNRLDENGQRRALETIHRNAQAQTQLIEDILDVSRIISGKLKLDARPVELSSVVEAATEAVLPSAQAKEIRIQKTIDSGLNIVSGDPHRLQQIIWNILSNAVKFTPKGGFVQIKLQRLNSHIEISIADTGIGISPKMLPFIFDRFSQAESATNRRYGGLGLGLAIVRHLVEIHAGSIEAHSEGEGQGAIFTIKLPLVDFDSVAQPESSKQRHSKNGGAVPPESATELTDLQILIVDDEEDGRTLVKTVLEQCGALVTSVSSVRAALTALQDRRFDILLSDIGMPSEDGYSLIRKVRSLPVDQNGKIPAVALTAYGSLEDRRHALTSGFQMHVAKPIEPVQLIKVVAGLTGRGPN